MSILYVISVHTCINRCIDKFLEVKKRKTIRNLYIQLDNVSSNKCWALLAGMAALVSLGLVRKLKMSYCLVGHTHEDIDALIGTVISRLRTCAQVGLHNFIIMCY